MLLAASLWLPRAHAEPRSSFQGAQALLRRTRRWRRQWRRGRRWRGSWWRRKWGWREEHRDGGGGGGTAGRRGGGGRGEGRATCDDDSGRRRRRGLEQRRRWGDGFRCHTERRPVRMGVERGASPSMAHGSPTRVRLAQRTEQAKALTRHGRSLAASGRGLGLEDEVEPSEATDV